MTGTQHPRETEEHGDETSVTSPPARSPRRSYAERSIQEESERIEGVLASSVWFGPALVLALAVLAWALGSAPAVILYVLGLGGVAWGWGINRLRSALQVTLGTAKQVRALSSFLGKDPTQEQLLKALHEQADQHAPAASPTIFTALLEGQVSPDRAGTTARLVYSDPLAKLDATSFLRSSLVLGGLFGTVLFFAWELTGAGFTAAGLDELLPGVRGAMASTLSGILSSVLVGHFASSVDRIVDRLVTGTESLIAGPVSIALENTPAHADPTNEAELWSAVLGEVRALREDTRQHVRQMADDASAYARSLQRVEERLADLPAIRIHDDLQQLGDALASFGRSVKVFEASSTSTAKAVEQLGVVIPRAVIERLDRISQDQQEAEHTTSTATQHLSGEIAAVQAKINEVASSVAFDPAEFNQHLDLIGQSVQALEPALRSQISTLGTVEANVREQTQQLGSLQTSVLAQAGRIESMHAAMQSVADAQISLVEMREQLEGAAGQVRTEAERLTGSTQRLEVAAEAVMQTGSKLDSAAEAVTAVSDRIDRAAESLSGQAAVTARIEKVLSGIQKGIGPIAAWHRRATDAPLMRLLLLQRRGGNGNGALALGGEGTDGTS